MKILVQFSGGKDSQACKRVINWLHEFGFRGKIILYTMIYGDINECYNRISVWKKDRNKGIDILCHSQPMLDFNKTRHNIPQWQRDMARWSNKRELYFSFDFKDYQPRKKFKCCKYFE